MGVRARGFTLVELLVVMLIIGLVSVLAIPAVVHSYGERSIQSAATLVQSTLSMAMADAARYSASYGVRFVPDPTLPGACSRIVSIGPAPDYADGLLSTTEPTTLPAGFVLPFPCLMVESSPVDAGGLPAGPAAWTRNVRVGDQIRTTSAGPWYTVVGPTDPANPTDENFVTPTQVLDRGDGRGPLDYLWLVNNADDDSDGFVDNGWDGVDNNANGVTDEPLECEVEQWKSPRVTASPYTIRRRPVPIGNPRGLDLPAGVVVDTAGLPPEILIDATGAAAASGPYGNPSRLGLAAHEYRIHLIERGKSDHEAWVILARTGAVTAEVQSP